jgi:hypothetical protein
MIESESSTVRLKQELIDYVRYTLGDQIVDLELDAEHYETAYQRTLGTYRQRAQNATEESYIFMELVDNVNIYTMPQEVQSVRQIYRRTFGNATGPFASNFDPFSQASLNVYLMNFNVSGGLATYDFYSQYVELAGRMFGAYVVYTFNTVTKKLHLHQSCLMEIHISIDTLKKIQCVSITIGYMDNRMVMSLITS